MQSTSNKTLFVLFLLVAIYSLIVSVYRPWHNFDMVMYVAAAKNFEESDINALQDFTYQAVRASVPESTYAELTGNSNNDQATAAYRNQLHTDPSAFEEQLPFYHIRPLYNGAIYLLHKAGIDIVFATHLISAVAVVVGLALLYALSISVLGYPFAYAIPFFAFIFDVGNLAKLSTPDGMTFLVIVLSAYFYLKNKTTALLFLFPLMIGIRTDLVLYVFPFLFAMVLSKAESRPRLAASTIASAMAYFAIVWFSGNAGWSTVFYFSFVEWLTHPISMPPPSLTVDHYIQALIPGLMGFYRDVDFQLYGLITLCFFSMTVYGVKMRLWPGLLRSPTVLLSVVGVIFVSSHIIALPIVTNRYFIGAYLVGFFSLLILMRDYCRRERKSM